MAAPTIDGTPVSTSGNWSNGSPPTVNTYAHPGGELWAVYTTGYSPDGAPVGCAANAAAMTLVGTFVHPSNSTRTTIYRLPAADAPADDYDVAMDVPASADDLGTLTVFSVADVNAGDPHGTLDTYSWAFGSEPYSNTITSDSNALVLAICLARRYADAPNNTGALSDFPVTATSGTTIVNTGCASANTAADRTFLFTMPGGATVTPEVNWNDGDPYHGMLCGVSINGTVSGGGNTTVPALFSFSG